MPIRSRERANLKSRLFDLICQLLPFRVVHFHTIAINIKGEKRGGGEEGEMPLFPRECSALFGVFILIILHFSACHLALSTESGPLYCRHASLERGLLLGSDPVWKLGWGIYR